MTWCDVEATCLPTNERIPTQSWELSESKDWKAIAYSIIFKSKLWLEFFSNLLTAGTRDVRVPRHGPYERNSKLLTVRYFWSHSFSYPLFVWVGSRGQQPQEDSKYSTSRATAISDKFFWLHTKTGPRKVGDAIAPLGPWWTSLASPIFPGPFWSHVRTNAAISRFREVTRHSGLYEFQYCALCREVSHPGLFAKSHLCRLYLR